MREIVEEVDEEIKDGVDFVGREFGNFKVAVGNTGTLKFENVGSHHGHH